MDQNDDPGKIKFGLYVTGKLKEGNESGHRQSGGQQEHRAAIISAQPNQIHGFMRTLDFSGRP